MCGEKLPSMKIIALNVETYLRKLGKYESGTE